MKKIGLIALLAALLCGAAVYLYLGSVEQRIAAANQVQEIEMTQVVVADRLIPAMTPITEDMLRYEQYPADYVNAGAAKSFEQVVGLLSDGTVVEGELILTAKLGTAEEIGTGLSCRVPDGMRAMTVNLETDAGAGGYITKGDRIDLMLYVTAEAEEGSKSGLRTESGETYRIGGSVVTVVLEAAEVLELGEVTFDSDGGGLYSGVTLALTPKDCLKLYAAMKQGQLYAALRQRDDVSRTDGGFYTVSDLLNG